MTKQEFAGPMVRLLTLPMQSGGDPAHRRALIETYYERLGHVLTPAAWALWVDWYLAPRRDVCTSHGSDGRVIDSEHVGYRAPSNPFLPTAADILASIGSEIHLAITRSHDRTRIRKGHVRYLLHDLNCGVDPVALDEGARALAVRLFQALPEGERGDWLALVRDVRQLNSPETVHRNGGRPALPEEWRTLLLNAAEPVQRLREGTEEAADAVRQRDGLAATHAEKAQRDVRGQQAPPVDRAPVAQARQW